MFIAMNNFRVASGKEAEFEQTWRDRKSYLQGVPGFVRFALLRGDEPGQYISHSTWTDRDAFIAWTKSESFVAGHRQGSLMGVLEGPPAVKLYDAVIEEAAPEHAAT
ncbi:MAG: antibiotic biosynthesis monooxygenase family protein [Dehalococcoidia bacterium]